MPTEFEWKIFSGITTLGLEKIQSLMTDLQCEPENFKGRIIFRSMFNDTVWDAKGNDELCVNNSKTIKEYAERFPRCHWFLGHGSEKKWYGTYEGKPDGSWNRTAEKMLQNFAGSGHPIFRCTNSLERGQLSKGGEGQQVISTEARRTLICSSIRSSLSISSVFTEQWRNMFLELPVDLRAPEKPVASGQLDKQEILT